MLRSAFVSFEFDAVLVLSNLVITKQLDNNFLSGYELTYPSEKISKRLISSIRPVYPAQGDWIKHAIADAYAQYLNQNPGLQ